MRTAATIVVAAFCIALALPLSAACPSTTFTTQQTRVDGPWAIHSLEALDYDGDHLLDVIGLRQDTNGGPSTLVGWRGRGNGAFDVPVSLGTSGIYRMAVADVNDDGRLDLIMMASKQLLVRLANGGGFDPPVVKDLDYYSSSFAVVSFDGDGFIDLIINSYSDNSFTVYHGEGNGEFTSVRRGTARESGAIAAADFDADGRVDVAYSRSGTNTIEVIFQNSDGSYTAPLSLQSGAMPYGIQANFVTTLTTADVDEDGKPDLVASNWEDSGANASVVILRSAGSRTFTRSVLVPAMYQAPGNWISVRARDINADGHVDIIATSVNGGLVMTFHGKGDGTFFSPSYQKQAGSPSAIHSVALGDFDGDGITDLALGGSREFAAAKGACATQVYLFTISPVITEGQSAPLRALISGIGPDAPLPRGTVTFREGRSVLGTADIDASGYAQLDASGLPAGEHTVTADFGGNAAVSHEPPVVIIDDGAGNVTPPPFDGSPLYAPVSQSILEKVITGASTLTIYPPSSPSVYGTPTKFSLGIRHPDGFGVDGWCFLDVDGVKSKLYSGAVSLQLSPGPHTISASFPGNTYTPPSSAGPQVITTGKATPAMTNSAGAWSVRAGEAHTLQITMSGWKDVAGPTGTIQLLRGSTILAAGPVSNGAGTLSATLERGWHDVTAVYSGDGNFNGAALKLTLSVMPNLPLAIEARGLQNVIWIHALLPPNATAATLYRSPAGFGTWTAVPGWSPQYENDIWVPLHGVSYDYRLSAVVSGSEQTSNIASAMITDDP